MVEASAGWRMLPPCRLARFDPGWRALIPRDPHAGIARLLDDEQPDMTINSGGCLTGPLEIGCRDRFTA
ncbi:MAG TPA: hypothetical protein VL985_15290 [Stellaceae bacterium]|nr:hypothetical protein [Stellaceae bacterium]